MYIPNDIYITEINLNKSIFENLKWIKIFFSTLKSVEAFDPAKKNWKKMQPMNIARVGLAATTFENLIWVAGGISNSITDPLLKEVECYDPCKKS